MATQAQWRSYVALFCGLGLVVTGAVSVLNYQVDPYLTHQWQTPHVQRLLSGRERLTPWGKTYALAAPGAIRRQFAHRAGIAGAS